MVMKQVRIAELKAKLSEFLRAVQSGESIAGLRSLLGHKRGIHHNELVAITRRFAAYDKLAPDQGNPVAAEFAMDRV